MSPSARDRPAPSSWVQARLVASMTRRDLVRRRATWTTTLLTGALIAVMVVGAAVISNGLRLRAEASTYRVAVDGAVAEGPDFLDAMDGAALVIDPVDDAAAMVTQSEAAVGLRVPPDIDGRIAAGETPEVDVFYRSQSGTSVAALNELLLQLQTLQIAEVRAGGDEVGAALPAPTAFVEREVTLEPIANRLSLGPTLAAVAAMLCLGVVTSAASASGSGRDDRSLESLLVLPFRRGALAAGTLAGVVPVAVLQLVAAVGLICAATAIPVSGLNQAPADVARMVAVVLPAAALLGVLAAAVGCLAGVLGAGAEDSVSIGDLLAVPFIGVAAAFFLTPTGIAGPLAWAAPIVGPVTMIRDGITGALTPAQVLVVTVTGVMWIAGTMLLVTRRIGDERRVLRIS